MSKGMKNSAHTYRGTQTSRALRKLSKLGKSISLKRLDELLKQDRQRKDNAT